MFLPKTINQNGIRRSNLKKIDEEAQSDTESSSAQAMAKSNKEFNLNSHPEYTSEGSRRIFGKILRFRSE